MEAGGASSGYTVGMASDRFQANVRGLRFTQALERFSVRSRRTSLYTRVVAINAAIVAGATVMLALDAGNSRLSD